MGQNLGFGGWQTRVFFLFTTPNSGANSIRCHSWVNYLAELTELFVDSRIHFVTKRNRTALSLSRYIFSTLARNYANHILKRKLRSRAFKCVPARRPTRPGKHFVGI